MSSIKITAHDSDFEPKRAGRPPSVDVTDFLEVLNANPGVWHSAEYTEAESKSVVRQFKQYSNIDVSTKSFQTGYRTVYAKVEDE